MTTIHLHIHSAMAAGANRVEPRYPSCDWEGDVEVNETFDVADVNEIIFRLFNRVDTEDFERLEAQGYELPSLSVGDVITWHKDDDPSRRFVVDIVGFSELTG